MYAEKKDQLLCFTYSIDLLGKIHFSIRFQYMYSPNKKKDICVKTT